MAVLLDNNKHKLCINGNDNQILINNEKYLDYGIYIFPGKVKYGDEAFVITVDIPIGNLNFYIPLNGYEISGTQNAPYNWIINWGDNITETKSGISSSANTNCIQHTYLTSGIYKIVIKPVVNNYQWMRAWGFLTTTTGNANTVTNKNKIINFDYLTNKSFMESSTSYGQSYLRQLAINAKIIYPVNEIQTVNENNISNIDNNFRFQQYFGCSNLTTTTLEVLPSSITSIGNEFRSGQYFYCSNLTVPAAEVIPNSITSIGHDFRYGQYSYCSNLTITAVEVLSNNITIINNNFRSGQYNNCHKLTTPTEEVLHNNIGNIGNGFRNNQYSSCYNLTVPAAEVIPNSITSIGHDFRFQQYFGCSNLTTTTPEVLPNNITSINIGFRTGQYAYCSNLTIPAVEVLPNSITSIGNDFRSGQYAGCSNLTTTAVEVLPNSITSIGDNFRYQQYDSCSNILIGNHIHLRMDEFINTNIYSNNYREMFSMFYIGEKTTLDTIPKYKDKLGNIYPITNLTPSTRLYYCTNRTGIDGYASLHANWK